MIEKYNQRIDELSKQISLSAAMYGQKENELKQHLANHNVLIGQHSEAQKILGELTMAVMDLKAPEETTDIIEHEEE